MYIKAFHEGRDMSIDIAVICPIRGTFRGDAKSVERYSDLKHQKYYAGFFNTQVFSGSWFSLIQTEEFGGSCCVEGSLELVLY